MHESHINTSRKRFLEHQPKEFSRRLGHNRQERSQYLTQKCRHANFINENDGFLFFYFKINIIGVPIKIKKIRLKKFRGNSYQMIK